MLQSGSLEISDVRLDDSDNFTCMAVNEAGEVKKTIRLR